jgi:hypothetical protein
MSSGVFNRQTLFVLGAGSSFEAGLPVGHEIARRIGNKADIRFEGSNVPVGAGDFPLFGQITNSLQDHPNEYQQAAWLIRDGIVFAQSIDDFLDQHRTNAYVNAFGKAAIAKAIVEAELACKLYFNPFQGQEMFDVSDLASTWFVKFMYMLGRGVAKENVREILDKVSFVVFNYDRCLEFFLVHALRRLYRLNEQEAQSIVNDLHIVHPYGVVPSNVPFGNTGANFARIADQIKTYTEQMGAGDVISAVGAELSRAECIIFLGFAYHSQNMALLRPAERMKTRPVFGTAFGMSDADVEVVSHDLASFFAPPMDARTRRRMIRLENKLKCADLFDNYARSLTGG